MHREKSAFIKFWKKRSQFHYPPVYPSIEKKTLKTCTVNWVNSSSSYLNGHDQSFNVDCNINFVQTFSKQLISYYLARGLQPFGHIKVEEAGS